MSTVKISGNASGSGSLTIAAPNTNSDLTLNLPTTLGSNNGSAVVTTDAAGNLGLGVTPSAWNSGYKALQINQSGLFSTGADLGLSANVYVDGSGTSRYIGSFAYGSRYYQYNGKHQWDVTTSTQGAGNAISFTQAMTLDSSGNLLVGTTATGIQAGRSMNWVGTGDGTLYLNHSTANASGDTFITLGYNGTKIGSITQNGTTAVAYNTSSDYRLKEDVQPMTGALATVAALKPVTYKWKADGSDGQGFIAHELQEVVPDCVTGEKDAVDEEGNPVYQGIDTSFLVATLTAAIQELSAQTTALKADLDATKAELAALKGAQA